ncbi:aldose 1-epimerase [Qipengyuania gaetbuli]|uniref:aldose 1-epimerase n=1 Tax=Qipengyuania gaetbuli TaxID=266952 RepID=UPI001CFC5432|nr:aldose 1-epimerase [Qipengyuania gaetbuli]
MDCIGIAAGDYRLELAPYRGGSIAGLSWHGLDILRPAAGEGVLDSSCFPLVPFSNRITGSRFAFAGREIRLEPNHPAAVGEPVLHGFGWLAAWSVAELSQDRAVLVHENAGGAWPWPYRASAGFVLDKEGLLTSLDLENLSADPMPAGLGFHPYFPRTGQTIYRGLHRGEWEVGPDCLPRDLRQRQEAADWWDGRPVASREVDTVYTGRQGPLEIEWPERALRAVIDPSEDLGFTTVYVPAGEGFFCVEPVSHATDVFNNPVPENGMRILQAGERWRVSMRIRAEATA